MKLMVWDDYLASLAEKWAAECRFEHGQPKRNRTDHIGQNLVQESGRYNAKEGIEVWYEEKKYYDYDTLQCTKGQMCGHYTQVVWANSEKVGCASHRCPSFTYLVCNYLPAGNYDGEKPFKKGPRCSKCDSGAGWCKDGLCNRKCSKSGKDCKCAAICYNCAKLDKKKCRCKCADGLAGADCKDRCEDKHEKCNAGWYKYWCNDTAHHYVRKQCLVMCNRCTPDENAVAGDCEPNYGPRADRSYSSVSRNASPSTLMTVVMLAMNIIVLTISNKSAL